MDKLKYKSLADIHKLCNSMEIPPKKNKKDCIDSILRKLQEEKYRYKTIRQLGNKGKEARTYLVIDKKNMKEYAMKTYRKNKSKTGMLREIKFQSHAAKSGISPYIYDYDVDINKMIVMDKMDNDLVDVISKQKGVMTVNQQKEIIQIFKTLDKIGVFHGDPNLLNFMTKNGKFYVIDYGFSELIDKKNASKYASMTPNIDFMPIAFLVHARNIFPESKFTYIEKFVKKENADKITLKKV